MTPINASTVSLAERYVREHFGLSIPITMEILKSAFRQRAKELHTDTSGSQATKDKFIAMKSAYDFLVKLDGMQYVFGERAEESVGVLETTDGTPLFELGLGLGHMKNGRDCERCNHKGYTERTDAFFDFSPGEYCTDCDFAGYTKSVGMCGPCGGSGMFKQKSGRLVPCRVCRGTGLRFGQKKICPKCNGTKRIRNTPRRVRYERCYECHGTGEIELMNPVWAKARMSSNRQKR